MPLLSLSGIFGRWRKKREPLPFRRVFPRLELLEARTVPAISGVDINSGVGSSVPQHLTNVNGTLFFEADDGSRGYELWKSTVNGTTALVKDINPSEGSFPITSNNTLTNVNGTLFFSADNGTNGLELWKSDGTANGTVMVKDINSGSGSSIGAETARSTLTNVNGVLFFAAFDSSNGYELWKSDGTSNGTVMVKDINSGLGSSDPHSFVNVNGTLFFTANNGIHGRELWKSDGTQNGTVMVKDINDTADASSFVIFEYTKGFLANMNGVLYFLADDGEHGSELWKSDGTTIGTVLVKDMVAGATSYQGFLDANSFVYLTGQVVFGLGDQLWKSDGTANGTSLIQDMNSTEAPPPILQMTLAGNVLVFVMETGVATDPELWQYDGSSLTGFINTNTDLNTLGGDDFADRLVYVAETNTLYFTAFSPATGSELYSVNMSTRDVTVHDATAGAGSTSYVNEMLFVPDGLGRGTLFFRADIGDDDPDIGEELFYLII